MVSKPWEKIQQEYAFKGYRNMVRKTFRLPSGQLADYHIVDGSSFVSIVAITENKEVILVKEYRPGPEDFMLSFPAGYIEEGESPEKAAQRELLEETGYSTGKLQFLKEVTTAYSHIKKMTFLATNCRKVADQQLDEDEFLALQFLPIEQLEALLIDPNIRNFVSVDCGLLALIALKTNT